MKSRQIDVQTFCNLAKWGKAHKSKIYWLSWAECFMRQMNNI